MAISLFGQTWVPSSDDDSSPNLSTGATHAITPPSSMVSGQVVLLFAAVSNGSGSYTPVISQAGGQTWTAHTVQNTGNTYARLFSCIFNGTWSADPSVDFGGTTGTYPIAMWLGAFDGVDNADIFDVDPTGVTYASSTSKPLAAITTNTPNAYALHLWGEPDDNTLTFGTNVVDLPWRGPSGNKGALHTWVGNIAGNDCGIMVAGRSVAAAGSSGEIGAATSTGDPGTGYDLALKAAAVSVYPVGVGAAYLQSTGVNLDIAVPTCAENDILIAFIARASSIDYTATPAGWTWIASDDDGGNGRVDAYWKLASASESGTYRWTMSQNARANGQIIAFRGANTVAPIDKSGTFYDQTVPNPISLPTLTPTTSGLSVLYTVGRLATACQWVRPAGYAEWTQTGDTAADLWGAVASRWVTGATGAVDYTPVSTPDEGAGIHLILKAAAAAASSKPYYYAMNNQL